MNTKNNSSPAFPLPLKTGDGGFNLAEQFQDANRKGLTKREWFAGMALQGFLSNPVRMDNMVKAGVSHDLAIKKTAQHSIEMADALIAELEK